MDLPGGTGQSHPYSALEWDGEGSHHIYVYKYTKEPGVLQSCGKAGGPEFL